MILVDTSVWIAHMRHGDDKLVDFLDRGQILFHPFVVGEIALGGAKPQTIKWLKLLPAAEVATDNEVLRFIQRHDLAGQGIGYVDTHLVASCFLTPDARLWTLDKSLQSTALNFGLSHDHQDRNRLQ